MSEPQNSQYNEKTKRWEPAQEMELQTILSPFRKIVRHIKAIFAKSLNYNERKTIEHTLNSNCLNDLKHIVTPDGQVFVGERHVGKVRYDRKKEELYFQISQAVAQINVKIVRGE